MKFLFDDAAFSFQALRTAGHAAYAGADLGEVLAASRNIPDGDEEAWCREWTAVAERLHHVGAEALAAGHRVSARESLLRASNYYRTADFFRVEDRDSDLESARLARCSRQTFAQAAQLFDTPVVPLRIPYDDTTLPGYLFLVDDTGRSRPPSSTTADTTPAWRSCTSWRPAGHCAAATTSSPSKAPASSPSGGSRDWSSGRTGNTWSRPWWTTP